MWWITARQQVIWTSLRLQSNLLECSFLTKESRTLTRDLPNFRLTRWLKTRSLSWTSISKMMGQHHYTHTRQLDWNQTKRLLSGYAHHWRLSKLWWFVTSALGRVTGQRGQRNWGTPRPPTGWSHCCGDRSDIFTLERKKRRSDIHPSSHAHSCSQVHLTCTFLHILYLNSSK